MAIIKTEIDTGKDIKQDLNEMRLTITWLASKISINRSELYKILRTNSMDTGILMNIAITLGINYFAIYSEYVRKYLLKKSTI